MRCHAKSFGSVAFDSPLGFDTKIELQLPVDLVDMFMVPAKAFDITKVRETEAKAPVPMGHSQADGNPPVASDVTVDAGGANSATYNMDAIISNQEDADSKLTIVMVSGPA